MANRWGNDGGSDRLYFLGPQNHCRWWCSHEIKRRLCLGRKAMTNLDSILKSRDINFADKGPSRQSFCFSSSYVWVWELGHKESWAPENWCFWIVVFKSTRRRLFWESTQEDSVEKTLESPLDCKEIHPVHPLENLSEYSLEGLMLKPKLQHFGHLMQRTDSLEKTLMLGKIEGRRRGHRGWDGWMASPTRWIWVCASSRSW